MDTKEKAPMTIWQRGFYLGIILIIVGYVSFTNHKEIGDTMVVFGASMVVTSKWMKWRARKLQEA